MHLAYGEALRGLEWALGDMKRLMQEVTVKSKVAGKSLE